MGSRVKFVVTFFFAARGPTNRCFFEPPKHPKSNQLEINRELGNATPTLSSNEE